ncbi:invasion associated locus B family protein [Pseudomonadota bacterium]
MKFPSLFTFAALALVVSQTAHAEIIGEHGDWTASKNSESGQRVCHMSAEPQSAKGNYTKRGAIYLIITHRPAEKRIGEVGVQAGYTFKKGSQVTATVDRKAPFKMFTSAGFAWGESAKDDQAMIRAMRAGSTLVIKGTSGRGTLTTDTYSLKGFTAAYKAISKACGVK